MKAQGEEKGIGGRVGEERGERGAGLQLKKKRELRGGRR